MDVTVCLLLLSTLVTLTLSKEYCVDQMLESKCFVFKKHNACDPSSKYFSKMSISCRKTCGLCSPDCYNRLDDKQCETLKTFQACQANHKRMRKLCPRACNFCETSCSNNAPGCDKLVSKGFCTTDRERMMAECKQSCGWCKPVTACDDHRCPHRQVCYITRDNKPACKCQNIKCKFSSRTGKVCATNGKQYINLCHLQKDECRQARTIPVKKYGLCFEKKDLCEDSQRESENGLCMAWKESGLCENMKTLMMKYCKKTCNLCRAPSPPACASSQFGCCWHSDVPAQGPNMLGCQACRDAKFCPRFVGQCGAVLNKSFMKGACPQTCNYCSPYTVVHSSNGATRRS